MVCPKPKKYRYIESIPRIRNPVICNAIISNFDGFKIQVSGTLLLKPEITVSVVRKSFRSGSQDIKA